ncbi:hypothetical protein FA15DRAFT_665153 [Coprinopsis marcescibilis]|uniref:Extracellular membrane protein CFEM domain-containing protein n=1 Tax=Coprinopsis marcescibilis TaxID=230819 RepID=A0A5C3L7Q0_COPMA|nr:hypothetical protein FA15DRAFT_665153 [Coprinopsis marcescibilis]
MTPLLPVLTFWTFTAARLMVVAAGPLHDVFANHIEARQTVVVPTRCRAYCNPVNSVIAGGCSPGECCNQPFLDAFVVCYTCNAAVRGFTSHAGIRQIVRSIRLQCRERDVELIAPPLPSDDAPVSFVPPRTTYSVPPTSAPFPFPGTPAPSPLPALPTLTRVISSGVASSIPGPRPTASRTLGVGDDDDDDDPSEPGATVSQGPGGRAGPAISSAKPAIGSRNAGTLVVAVTLLMIWAV